MARKTLTPETIVDAAIAISARNDGDAITGRTLGDELGVDRSAVWRHFADQDALLRAIGDRLLVMSLANVAADLPPHERMKALARSLVHTFEAHPSIGAAVAGRTTQEAAEFAVVEATLQALLEVGVPADRLAGQQRMIAETILGYANLRASQALLPPEIRRGDRLAWSDSYAAASRASYPAIAQHALDLATVSDDEVLELLLDALWASVQTITTERAS